MDATSSHCDGYKMHWGFLLRTGWIQNGNGAKFRPNFKRLQNHFNAELGETSPVPAPVPAYASDPLLGTIFISFFYVNYRHKVMP